MLEGRCPRRETHELDFLTAWGVHSLLLFATTVFVVNATPGADMLLSFTQTMKHGVRGGMATALGISSGGLVHTVFVMVGVAALLLASPRAYAALLWVGAGYLLWIAITLVRDGLREPVGVDASDAEVAAIGDLSAFGRSPMGSRVDSADRSTAGGTQPGAPAALGAPVAALAKESAPSLPTLFAQGLATNVLNPKVALFYLALLPQFVVPATPNKTPAIAFLGVWFAVQGFVFLALFVKLVARLRRWQPTPMRRRALHFVAAAALALVAVRLLLVPASA
jgi:threonine/homoserine/homoserine lactone efflux protein